MSILQAVGLSIFPNLGGFIGSSITRTQIKTWYEVKLVNQINYSTKCSDLNKNSCLEN